MDARELDIQAEHDERRSEIKRLTERVAELVRENKELGEIAKRDYSAMVDWRTNALERMAKNDTLRRQVDALRTALGSYVNPVESHNKHAGYYDGCPQCSKHIDDCNCPAREHRAALRASEPGEQS